MNSTDPAASPITSIADVVALWPSRPAFADDNGVKIGLVNSWVHRDAIPDPYWLGIVESAKRRGIAGVTLEVLAGLRARRRHAPHSPTASASLATGT